jgi:hypothetical protein
VEPQLRDINVLAAVPGVQQEERGLRVHAAHPPVVDDVQPKKEAVEVVPPAMEEDANHGDAAHPLVADDAAPKEEAVDVFPPVMEEDVNHGDAAHPLVADDAVPKKEEAVEVVPPALDDDNDHVRGSSRDTPRPERIEGSVAQKVSIVEVGR